MHEVELRFTDNGQIITNSDIAEESLEIHESICSEDRLVYGSCESTSVKLRIRSADAFKLRTFALYYDGILQGTFRVESDKATADRCYKDIVAYDKMHQILNSVCTAWYNSLEFPMTLRMFRDAFFDHYGVNQMAQTLINDNMLVYKTIEADTINASTVIKSICELNACFGHIQPSGVFKYVTLYAQGMTPALPIAPYSPITAEYEDFKTEMVEKVIIRKEEGDAGATVGSGTNAYIIEDNFLCYGLSNVMLQSIAQKIFEQIRLVTYTPLSISGRYSNYLNVGAIFGFTANDHGVISYVLERTITGIQSRAEEIVAQGMKTYRVTTSNFRDQIVLLKSKTNILQRNVDETRSTIADVEQGLTAEIVQTANSIATEVARATGAEAGLRTAIQQSESAIRAEVTERTSIYNEEVNSVKGGTDGNIDLSFFPKAETEFDVTTIGGKQCIVAKPIEAETLALYQDASLPAGTFKLSYEWLRQAALFRDESVILYAYTPTETKIYEKALGTAWIDDNVWFAEEFEFTLDEPARVRFNLRYMQDYLAPDRTMDVAITNIRIMGQGQSVADAIGEMKAEINMQSDKIEAKVSKDGIIAAINLTAEAAVIEAARIDLRGIVTADELTTAFASVGALEAQTGRIDSIIANYITADTVAANFATIGSLQAQIGRIDEIESKYISAETVKADYMEVTNWVTAGKIKADKIDVNSIKANVMTVANISAACTDPRQGNITIGVIRAATYQYYNGTGYNTLSMQNITDKDGNKFRCLGYRV